MQAIVANRHLRNLGISSTVLLAAGLATSSSNASGKQTIEQIRNANKAINLTKKRVVVVGGTSGIGEGIAKRLAKANASVTIVGRSYTRGQAVIAELTQLGGEDHDFIPCDSFYMKNIIKTAEIIKEKYNGKLDYLVLTQGMATMQGRTETSEGIDQKLALHYFGRMLFTKELLPLLRQAAEKDNVDTNPSHSGKVLTVLSAGVHTPYTRYQEDFEVKQFSLTDAANACGYYNDLGFDALSKQPGNEKIAFIHAAPGFVRSNWGTEMPWYIKSILSLIKVFGRSIDDCGEAMCDPLFNHVGGGLVLIDQNANLTKVTDKHTEEARAFVLENTMKVLEKAIGKTE